MGWEAWVTLGVIGLMGVALVRAWAAPDTVLLGGMALFMTLGLASPHVPGTDATPARLGFPSPATMAAGFGNEGILTIAVLFVVAAGLAQTGAMGLITRPLLGTPRTALAAQVRMMLPVAGLSAVMNNTPIVAMFVPVVSDWCRKAGLSPSKLFIPLSYAAILGGTCTLIGTATNIYIYGWLDDGLKARVGMFTLAWVGLPAAVAGLAYILLAGRWVLPDRKTAGQDLGDDVREYTVEMLVAPDSPLAGKAIEAAGLRRLGGAYLAQIERDGQQLVAVGPEQELRVGDRLIFVGIAGAVTELQNIRGLVPATNQVFKVTDPRPDRVLVEAVVSDQCAWLGMSIREARFRTRYNAVVLAVRRGGEHLRVKVGDIVLRTGDTLLIETHPRFIEQHGNSRDFYLTSAVTGSRMLNHAKAPLALALLAAMIVAVTVQAMTLFNAALLAAGGMILLRCCTPVQARQNINWRVLLMMGAAIGVGRTLSTSGAADGIAALILAVAERGGPTGILAGIYAVTVVFNMLVGHAGAAALAYPIAYAAAQTLGADFMPFVIVLMMAASADFANPVSYPTHLMVYGAGGYRFTDFVRAGLPLNLIVMAVTVTVTPTVFPPGAT